MKDYLKKKFFPKIESLDLEAAFNSKIKSKNIISVLYGPLEGLKYPHYDSVGSTLYPKLLGTYESELHEVFNEILNTQYDFILDIGAAEGYYAVGLALKIPKAKVIAFEGDEHGQALCLEMAELNNTKERVFVHGICSEKELLDFSASAGKGLIICDCEGYERDLFTEEVIKQLEEFDILLELHDGSYSGMTISQVMSRRFEMTHHVEFINVRYKKPIEHLEFLGFKEEELLKLLSEQRQMSVGWLFLKAK
jgi:hypothetical protein